MKAMELVNTKIQYQKKGTNKITNAFVTKCNVDNGEISFFLTFVTGKKVKAKVGDFQCDINESEIETNARKALYGLKDWKETKNSLPSEQFNQLNSLMGNNLMDVYEKQFNKAKHLLTTLRKEKSKAVRRDYNEGELHVFYDIVEGNNVDSFMTMDEIQQMKEQFAKPDFHRGIYTLDNLQAFDENFQLVLDEWNM